MNDALITALATVMTLLAGGELNPASHSVRVLEPVVVKVSSASSTNIVRAVLQKLTLPKPGEWLSEKQAMERSNFGPRLKPGIYTTAPYSCIVIAPGEAWDELAFVKPTARAQEAPMLQKKPELSFRPWSAGR